MHCPRCHGWFKHERDRGTVCINCGHCVEIEALKERKREELLRERRAIEEAASVGVARHTKAGPCLTRKR